MEPEYIWGPQERLRVVWSLREAMNPDSFQYRQRKLDRRRRENKFPERMRITDALRAEEWEILLAIQAEREEFHDGQFIKK